MRTIFQTPMRCPQLIRTLLAAGWLLCLIQNTRAQTPACVDSTLINPDAVCPAVYDPVCGCNGQTYGNSCEAINFGGVTSWTPGECAIDTTDCPDGCFFNIHYSRDGVAFHAWLLPDPTDPPLPDPIQWSLDDGAVTATGPEFFHLFDAPGSHVLCATYPKVDGNLCTVCKAFRVDAPCVDSSLIDTLVACPAIYLPVCGCDGVTYGNACEARYIHGIRAWQPGECGSICNGLFVDFQGLNTGGSLTFWSFYSQVIFPGGAPVAWFWDFGNGQTSTQQYPFLNFFDPGEYEVCLTVTAIAPDGTTCSSTVCHTVQVAGAFCPDPGLIDTTLACPAVYDPVCGCNGVTYGNACEAEFHHGVAVWTPGACPGDCIDPQWIDDQFACTEEYDPVCGCNGITYSNPCEALRYHGVTAWKKGACCTPPDECKAFFILEKLANYTVRLSDFSTNAESWTLDLGDGTVLGGYFDSLVHTYTGPGNYLICLSISNFAGTCSDTYCETVQFGSLATETPGAVMRLNLSPNPAQTRTTVRVDDAVIRTVAVYDVVGKKLLEKTGATAACELQLNGWADGLYLVVVETDRGVAVGKLMLRR